MTAEHCRCCNARGLLIESLEGQIAHHRARAQQYHEAITTLESERAANAALTTEVEALRVELLQTANERLKDQHDELKRLAAVSAENEALLEALRPFAAINASIGFTYRDVDRARAAIDAAKERT